MLNLSGKWEMKLAGDTAWQMGTVPGTNVVNLRFLYIFYFCFIKI